MGLVSRYRAGAAGAWSGRIDSTRERDAFRWHQVVEGLDLTGPGSPGAASRCFGLLGFCCDEGVRRNLGRTGAAKAPRAIRQELANLPVCFPESVRLFDAGDVLCEDGNLEAAQGALAEAVQRLLGLGLFPVVMGGGHEVALGHEGGIRGFLRQSGAAGERLGILSFDAHFDLRPWQEGPSSGTMFRQIAQRSREAGDDFSCLFVGIQKTGNTLSLFRQAEELGAGHILAKDIDESTLPAVTQALDRFVATPDHIYVTLCADVFSAAFAPGVSATQPFGMHPETVLRLLKHVLGSGKVVSFDIAEVSPRFDDDHQTAKLAAVVIYALVSELSGT